MEQDVLVPLKKTVLSCSPIPRPFITLCNMLLSQGEVNCIVTPSWRTTLVCRIIGQLYACVVAIFLQTNFSADTRRVNFYLDRARARSADFHQVVIWDSTSAAGSRWTAPRGVQPLLILHRWGVVQRLRTRWTDLVVSAHRLAVSVCGLYQEGYGRGCGAARWVGLLFQTTRNYWTTRVFGADKEQVGR